MTENNPDPFEQLATADTEEPVDIDALFAESSVTDSRSIWNELENGITRPIDNQPETPDISVIPKSSFCQDCPHLTNPPEVRCTHEGTEILGFPDIDHVRVRNCPIDGEHGGVNGAEETELLD